MDAVLTLVSKTRTQDQYGMWIETQTTREIFCQVESVTRAEFFDGGRNGLNPEFQFTVFSGDYEGETVCQYDGKQYAIYRTYRVPGTDYMELYAERKGGTNG
jgi:SPP1 family predicted phage head-tail adaptor